MKFRKTREEKTQLQAILLPNSGFLIHIKVSYKYLGEVSGEPIGITASIDYTHF